MQIKTPWLVLAIALACPALFAQPASNNEKITLLADQLTHSMGKKVIWEAPYAWTIRKEALPTNMEKFAEIIWFMNQRLADEHPEQSPLFVRVHPNALVVKTLSSAD
jgi:hypothetical protein